MHLDTNGVVRACFVSFEYSKRELGDLPIKSTIRANMTVVAPNGLANICIWPLTTIVLGAFEFDGFELDVADIVNNCTRPERKKEIMKDYINNGQRRRYSPTPVEAMTKLVLT